MPHGVRLLISWAFNVAALWVAARLLTGIDYRNGRDLVLAGLVFGIVNWLVKPILTVLSLPVIIVTVGIALFFINLLMLYLTGWLVPGFRIDSLGAAVLGTIVIWLVNVVLRSVFEMGGRRRGPRRLHV
jgi:putative membrane protein